MSWSANLCTECAKCISYHNNVLLKCSSLLGCEVCLTFCHSLVPASHSLCKVVGPVTLVCMLLDTMLHVVVCNVWLCHKPMSRKCITLVVCTNIDALFLSATIGKRLAKVNPEGCWNVHSYTTQGHH